MPARALLLSALVFSATILFPSFAPVLAMGPKTGYSGLPVPRFVNLKGETTNARVGPSLDYPVRYVFNRKGLPVRVVAETPDNVWRKVEDFEGETMWIHHTQLVTSSTVMIVSDTVYLHMKPSRNSEARAALEHGVLAENQRCEGDWCLLRVDGYRGWAEKSALWGVE